MPTNDLRPSPLANDPALLVADEPTGSLDEATADTVVKLFEQLAAQGTTVLLATHDMEIAKRATRILTLVDGAFSAAASGPLHPDEGKS